LIDNNNNNLRGGIGISVWEERRPVLTGGTRPPLATIDGEQAAGLEVHVDAYYFFFTSV
jgi:hypothetical protein